MQKIARSVPHKPARQIVHKRRATTAKPKLELQPIISRVIGDVDLVAPRGCSASVLLKLVTRDDDHRYYQLWAVAGRHGMDTFSLRYKHNGEDVLRFDVPEGMPVSAASLQPHLESYLAGESTLGETPPVIKD